MIEASSPSIVAELQVEVVKAEGLPKASKVGAYCIVMVDGKTSPPTESITSSNPVWNQKFSFSISRPLEVDVELSVYGTWKGRKNNRFNKFLGKTLIALEQLTDQKLHEHWLPLMPRDITEEMVTGQLLVRLHYKFPIAWKTVYGGMSALRQNSYEEAINNFSQAIEEFPDNYLIYSNRSRAYLSTKNYQKAISDATTAVQLLPTWVQGYYRLGIIHVQVGDFKKAEEAFRKGLKHSPDDSRLKQALQDLEYSAREKSLMEDSTLKPKDSTITTSFSSTSLSDPNNSLEQTHILNNNNNINVNSNSSSSSSISSSISSSSISNSASPRSFSKRGSKSPRTLTTFPPPSPENTSPHSSSSLNHSTSSSNKLSQVSKTEREYYERLGIQPPIYDSQNHNNNEQKDGDSDTTTTVSMTGEENIPLMKDNERSSSKKKNKKKKKKSCWRKLCCCCCCCCCCCDSNDEEESENKTSHGNINDEKYQPSENDSSDSSSCC